MTQPIQRAAVLPEELEQHDVLAELPIGQSGVFTVPWALSSYGVNGCYLSARYTYIAMPRGTASMRVTRTPDGYMVEIPQGYTFAPSTGFPAEDDLPVLHISIAKDRVWPR